jgi:hypothetical protein
MKFGDANTKYFHLMANSRKKENHIVSLQTENGLATSQRDKHSAIQDHFIQHIDTYAPRQCKLNFSALGWQQRALQHLDNSATEEKLYRVINGAPAEKKTLEQMGLLACFSASAGQLLGLTYIMQSTS